jgi:hypothetical protein
MPPLPQCFGNRCCRKLYSIRQCRQPQGDEGSLHATGIDSLSCEFCTAQRTLTGSGLTSVSTVVSAANSRSSCLKHMPSAAVGALSGTAAQPHSRLAELQQTIDAGDGCIRTAAVATLCFRCTPWACNIGLCKLGRPQQVPPPS